MLTQKARIFIATYRSYQATTKTIYDFLVKQGFDVVYHFSDDIQVDYDTVIKPHILARALVITPITPEGLQINHATNHYKLMLETAIQYKRHILPLMFFENTWETESIQENLPDQWQALTKFKPIHLNFSDFGVTLKAIEARLHSIDSTQIDSQPTSDTLALAPIELDNLESALKAEYVYERGNRYYIDKNYQEAKKYFDEAIELNPNFSDAYNNRALVHKHLKQLDNALFDIQQAIAISNSSIAIHFSNYSQILLDKSKYSNLAIMDESMDAAQKALEIDPKHAGAYNILGNIYGYLGNDVQAIEYYSSSIEINPQSDVLFYNRAIKYENTEQVEEALHDYSQAYELNPDNLTYLRNRAKLYYTSDVKLKSKLSIPRKGLDINTEARFKDVA